VPRGTKLGSIDVTAKAFFERLYLVPGPNLVPDPKGPKERLYLVPGPKTNAQRMLLLSHLLRSVWYPLVPDC